jgi:hypothetical protein
MILIKLLVLKKNILPNISILYQSTINNYYFQKYFKTVFITDISFSTPSLHLGYFC